MSTSRRYWAFGAIIMTLAMVCNTQAAIEVSYTFDNVGDTNSVVKDNNAIGGSQDATTGNSPTLAAGQGVLASTAMLFPTSTPDAYIATDGAISYSDMTLSAVINLQTRVGAANYILFATRNPNSGGWVQLDVRTDGGLEFYADGGIHYYASAASAVQFGTLQGVGVTVADAIATFYVNGVALTPSAAVFNDPLTDGGIGGGTSATYFGTAIGLSGGDRNLTHFSGYADNIVMANRAFSGSEMAAIQSIAVPEPASLGMLALGAIMICRRKRNA